MHPRATDGSSLGAPAYRRPAFPAIRRLATLSPEGMATTRRSLVSATMKLLQQGQRSAANALTAVARLEDVVSDQRFRPLSAGIMQQDLADQLTIALDAE